MNIVFFTHPAFTVHQSMPRFAKMLAEGMRERGHTIELISASPKFSAMSLPAVFHKWLGYIDQYIVFPNEVRKKLKIYSQDTLFVFTDHALGPWVPLVAHRPHVIHCHDFLAQFSALDKIPENRTSATGKQYQAYIRRGYTKGKNFISVSEKTKEDLSTFLTKSPDFSGMVYNGLNPAFQPGPITETRVLLSKKLNIELSAGFFLHVGGNQWYKNRIGIVALYSQWREKYKKNLPLLLIGEKPSTELLDAYAGSAYREDIHFLSGINDEIVRLAYAAATVFLFPSLAEGFGWPIAEAMAAGTLVLTTNEAPMTEVAGDAAFLVSRKPTDVDIHLQWAIAAADILEGMVQLDPPARQEKIELGLLNVKRFNLESALDEIEKIYSKVLQSHSLKKY